jgi:hypothetical protein
MTLKSNPQSKMILLWCRYYFFIIAYRSTLLPFLQNVFENKSCSWTIHSVFGISTLNKYMTQNPHFHNNVKEMLITKTAILLYDMI